jgi:hypothetical protein
MQDLPKIVDQFAKAQAARLHDTIKAPLQVTNLTVQDAAGIVFTRD